MITALVYTALLDETVERTTIPITTVPTTVSKNRNNYGLQNEQQTAPADVLSAGAVT